MLPRAPSRRTSRKPRAWRVTDQKKPPPPWQRLGFPVAAVAVAAGLGAALLLTTGAFGARAPRVAPTITPVPTRQIVSSTLSGSTPTATSSPLAVTPPPPVGAATLPAASAPPFSAGPPAQVQPVTPVAPPQQQSAAPSAAPSSLPGTLTPPRPAATAAPTQSIQDELRSIDATATALSAQMAALSGAGSATPGPSGTPRPAPSDTPIPTAAPPIVPQPPA